MKKTSSGAIHKWTELNLFASPEGWWVGESAKIEAM